MARTSTDDDKVQKALAQKDQCAVESYNICGKFTRGSFSTGSVA